MTAIDLSEDELKVIIARRATQVATLATRGMSLEDIQAALAETSLLADSITTAISARPSPPVEVPVEG